MSVLSSIFVDILEVDTFRWGGSAIRIGALSLGMLSVAPSALSLSRHDRVVVRAKGFRRQRNSVSCHT